MWRHRGRVRRVQWNDLPVNSLFTIFPPKEANTVFLKTNSLQAKRIISKDEGWNGEEFLDWTYGNDVVWTFPRVEGGDFSSKAGDKSM